MKAVQLSKLVVGEQARLFANHSFELADVRKAFEAIANRHTIGKVVLTP